MHLLIDFEVSSLDSDMCMPAVRIDGCCLSWYTGSMIGQSMEQCMFRRKILKMGVN